MTNPKRPTSDMPSYLTGLKKRADLVGKATTVILYIIILGGLVVFLPICTMFIADESLPTKIVIGGVSFLFMIIITGLSVHAIALLFGVDWEKAMKPAQPYSVRYLTGYTLYFLSELTLIFPLLFHVLKSRKYSSNT